MFIAHGAWLRKYAPWILAGVLVLLLPGFVLLFTPAGGVADRQKNLPTIGGKPVNPAEFQQAKNAIIAQHVISTGRQAPRTIDFNEQLTRDAVVRMLLLRKAGELGIRVSDEELVRQIRSQPFLLNENKQFDPELYRQVLIVLNNYGVTESQFEQIIREQIILMRLRNLVTRAVRVTPTELQLAYAPFHEKTFVDYVEFDVADHQQPLEVTEQDARAFFEQNQELFRAPAQTKVRYVHFKTSEARDAVTLSDGEIAEYYERNKSKYIDEQKQPRPLDSVRDEIQKELRALRAERLIGDRATEFTVRLVPEPGAARPDFAKVAEEFAVTVHETGFFSLRDAVAGIEAGPQFHQTAFTLGPDAPFSDPVRGEDGYYVLEYLDSKPSTIPQFEEVRQQVIERLKHRRAVEATVKRGRQTLSRLKEAMAAGKSFPDACAELGLKVNSPPAFTLAEDTPALPAASNVKELALGMATNTVSEFVPTPTGGLFFHLKRREPFDPEQFAQSRADFEQQILQRNRQALFQDWISSILRKENVDFGLRPRPQPLPEPPEQAETQAG